MVNLDDYLSELSAHLKTGEAREHTYRPACERLFTSFDDVQAANDQARTEFGATDYVFYKKSNVSVILGYCEAKDIDANLDKTEKTEQLSRYSGYDNLILTNYIEFRFYKNGICYSTVEIAKLNGLELIPQPENFSALLDEIQAFFIQPPEVIKSGKRLAEIMGGKARRIKTSINDLLKENQQDSTKAIEIAKIYALMKQLLVHDLEVEKFADMYAQTLVYGLFVARYNDSTPETFTRTEARELVPVSNPLLREFFDHIAGPRFETRLAVIVEELCQVFSVSDVAGIIDRHLKLDDTDQANTKDPIIHFYEDFLSEYDPIERKKMGAYYTPTPVVDYMVRAVDGILKKDFGLGAGLADSSKEERTVVLQGKKVKQSFHKVQVLDPATGTATFLNEIIKFVHEGFRGQEGMWPPYARDNLIPRLHGFELMMGAYTIAHLKLGVTLRNLGVEDIGKRVGVYLTNSLEEGNPAQADLFSFGLAEAVTFESNEAAHIKTERPIMVVIGNPPYSGVSSNNNSYANLLVNKYKFEPGGKQKLQERNPKWLNDDYVKFIAMSEDLIAKNGEGILAFITNHGYLDNPTFRGMRWHLVNIFDEINVINLHGNSKKQETALDGSKDENVFDIQQGVAIIIAIKKQTKDKKIKSLANVQVADLYGKRKEKFERLESGDINFKKIELDSKMYYFEDKNIEGRDDYAKGFSVKDMFLLNSVGIVTARDSTTIQFSKNEISKVLEDFSSFDESTLRSKYQLGKDARDWTVSGAKKDVMFNNPIITEICYRPLDIRWTAYTGKSKGFHCMPREKVMDNFVGHENVGLNFIRPSTAAYDFDIFISDLITDQCSAGNKSSGSGISYLAPLWLYDEQGNRSSNLDFEIVNEIKRTAANANEKTIFDYIYGVLHNPTYRDKYKEFLKIDFPRIPYPANQKEFDKFADCGKQLRELQLMRSPESQKLITTFPEAGTNLVDKIKFDKGNVYINETQFFGDVPEIAWNFYIGGYQPAQKWLKDRKGRELSSEDILHYQKIIKVLAETDAIVKRIG